MFLPRFLSDRRGTIAPTFVFTMIPLLGFIGAAVDYSRANSARTTLQSAVDATALMLSKDAQSLTDVQLTQKAKDYFNGLVVRADLKNVNLTSQFATPQQGSFKLLLTSTGTVNSSFFQLLGKPDVQITASSEVVWGMKRLEIALALDNTGSMASNGKLTQLKTAVHNLLTTLQTAAKKPDDVKVAIIPFDTTVKIGTGYKNEFWVDYSGWISKYNWEGCVEDRTQPNDTLDTTPVSGSASTLFPAVNCGSLAQAMPLTNDWTALNNKVDSMVASGNTNVTIGLVWAWHALTANLPLSEASSPAPDLDKVIILLTDGENTENRWTSNSTSIDARTTAACTAIKAANIKIYTVRVIDGNATLLQNCATQPSMYYNVTAASQLNAVFSSIAQTLANLRLSK